jgi:protein-tyrosine phosphatase
MLDSEALANWIELEGCFNFRDLGNYTNTRGKQIRSGQVFRADGLQRLTDSDLDRLCGEIGLGGVIDLRSSDEVEADGRGGIEQRIAIHHVPLFERTEADAGKNWIKPEQLSHMGDLYWLMLQAARRPIVEVVKLIAQADSPVVFHCAAGKDRTGVISSVLLSLLEVPQETIVADYAFSRRNIDAINERLGESDTYKKMMDAMPPDAYDADPAAMAHFLSKVIEEEGSVADWASNAGIDDGMLAQLQARLLV